MNDGDNEQMGYLAGLFFRSVPSATVRPNRYRSNTSFIDLLIFGSTIQVPLGHEHPLSAVIMATGLRGNDRCRKPE